jgi:CBS domain containing-hemolysin-like protein
MDSSYWPYLAIVILIALSAFFSGSEIAFASANKMRLKKGAAEKGLRERLAFEISENYSTALSSILIGNNLVNIAASSVATVIAMSIFGEESTKGPAIATAVMTILILIFGEITPKNLAKDFPEAFALFSAPIIQFLSWIFFAFNFLFSMWKKLLSKIFKTKEDTKMSQEELLMLVDEVEQDGSIDGDEGSLLRNVIEFTDLTADEILTRRVNVVGFSVDATREEIAQLFSDSKFSRLLVYDPDIDHISGVLHQKDFYTAEGITDRPIEELITPPLFIPATTQSSDLLRLFQVNQTHLAVVVDEYGETQGIVTMEDILEELVGDIWDEHDEIVENFRDLGDDTYEVDCEVSPEDFKEFFHVEIETECSTVNGWISEQLCKIPENDDAFEYENLYIRVVEIDSHRAKYAQVKIFQKPEEEEAEERYTALP